MATKYITGEYLLPAEEGKDGVHKRSSYTYSEINDDAYG